MRYFRPVAVGRPWHERPWLWTWPWSGDGCARDMKKLSRNHQIRRIHTTFTYIYNINHNIIQYHTILLPPVSSDWCFVKAFGLLVTNQSSRQVKSDGTGSFLVHQSCDLLPSLGQCLGSKYTSRIWRQR